MAKTALITGITGQDGSYLTEFLLDRGYYVYGLMRRSSSFNTNRIDHIYQDPHEPNPRLNLIYGDLNDGSSLNRILRDVQPDEIYNLGAQSHVMVSFDIPEYTGDVSGLGTARLLEAIRESHLEPRFYQASSSEMYGGMAQETPQNETTPFYPRSPYACAKAYAFYMVRNYREAYGFFACNGILFNHESPRRGETFVSRKITRAATRIKVGLQQDKPDDYVIATGEAHSVREFVEEAFNLLGLDWQKYVENDPRYIRPTEVDFLLGDSAKAEKNLGWKPKVGFKELVRTMVEADLELAKREAHMSNYPEK